MDEFRSRSCLHLYKRLYHQVQREWRPTGFKAFGNHQTNLHHTKVNISCFSLTEKMLIIHKWMLFCFVPCDVEICDDNWPNRMSVWTVTLKHSLWKKTSTWTGLLIHFAQAACITKNLIIYQWHSSRLQKKGLFSSPEQDWPGLLMLMSHPLLCCVGQVLGQRDKNRKLESR